MMYYASYDFLANRVIFNTPEDLIRHEEYLANMLQNKVIQGPEEIDPTSDFLINWLESKYDIDIRHIDDSEVHCPIILSYFHNDF